VLNEIPKLVQTAMAFITMVSLVAFFATIDLGNPDKADENLEKITKKLADEVVPTEVKWTAKAAEIIPYPLLIPVVLFIFWLFGHITFRNHW
jgi:Na+/H+ antiporter NhaC